MANDAQHTTEPAEADGTATEPEQSEQDTEGVPAAEDTDASGDTTADYWKRRARQNEERAKANHEELEKLRRESMSIAEAREGTRNEVLREVSGRLVDAEVRSSAINRPVNVDALLEGLDRGRFVTDDGEVDRDAVSTWLDQLAPVQQQPRTASDLGQGARGVNRASPDQEFGELIAQKLK